MELVVAGKIGILLVYVALAPVKVPWLALSTSFSSLNYTNL